MTFVHNYTYISYIHTYWVPAWHTSSHRQLACSSFSKWMPTTAWVRIRSSTSILNDASCEHCRLRCAHMFICFCLMPWSKLVWTVQTPHSVYDPTICWSRPMTNKISGLLSSEITSNAWIIVMCSAGCWSVWVHEEEVAAGTNPLRSLDAGRWALILCWPSIRFCNKIYNWSRH